MIRLGLIGDNILLSLAPRLHREAGRLVGLDVSYDLLIPRQLDKSFDRIFDDSRADGMRGLNITYPYKQVAVAKVEIEDPLLRRLGAINTVIFEAGRALGYNTDHSGFIAAYRAAFGDAQPGPTAIIGAGGVGSAVAFGLAALGAPELIIIDTDPVKADHLAGLLSQPGLTVSARENSDTVIRDMEGVVNCTPLGMVGHPGSPVDRKLLGPQRWAFEAIYTPRQTEFSEAAATAGLNVISGYELFVHQGIDAFRLFTGRTVDETALRAALST
jgi:shikimate dehydrogenase